MYIKVNNSSKVINIDDYVLIADLVDHLKNIIAKDELEVEDFFGDDYVTREELQGVLRGENDLLGYVTNEQLIEKLKEVVTGFEIVYLQTDDRDNAPAIDNVDWNEVIPEWENEKFIWQLIKVYARGTIQYFGPTCISGSRGDKGEKGQSLINIRPQWCLNNDGNWTDEMAIPSEYDELWTRSELTWENPDDITYTNAVRDQVFEKVKELNAKIVKVEEDLVTIQDDMATIKTDNDSIREDLNICITQEDLNKVLNQDDSNLLKNGNFYNGTKFWYLYGDGNNIPGLQEQIGYPQGKAIVFRGELQSVQQVYQVVVPTTNIEGTEYTFSCMVNSNNAADGELGPLYGLVVKVDYEGDYNLENEEFTAGIESFDETWNKLSLTFTVAKPVEKFECYFYVRDTRKTIKVSEFMLSNGSQTGAFKPSYNELFDSIPKYVSDLDNDLGFVAKDEVEDMIANIETGNIDTSKFALVEDIPVKVSELEQDIDYLLEVPEEYVTKIQELENEIIELRALIEELKNKL